MIVREYSRDDRSIVSCRGRYPSRATAHVFRATTDISGALARILREASLELSMMPIGLTCIYSRNVEDEYALSIVPVYKSKIVNEVETPYATAANILQ